MMSIEAVSNLENIFDNDEVKIESNWNGHRVSKHADEDCKFFGIISRNTFEKEATLAHRRISPKGGYVEGGGKADSDGNASASVSAGYESDDKSTTVEGKVEIKDDGTVSGEISVRQEF